MVGTWDKVKAWGKRTWKKVKDGFQKVVDWGKNVWNNFKPVVKTVAPMIQTVTGLPVDKVVDVVDDSFDIYESFDSRKGGGQRRGAQTINDVLKRRMGGGGGYR
jgi:hypothetical protein